MFTKTKIRVKIKTSSNNFELVAYTNYKGVQNIGTFLERLDSSQRYCNIFDFKVMGYQKPKQVKSEMIAVMN